MWLNTNCLLIYILKASFVFVYDGLNKDWSSIYIFLIKSDYFKISAYLRDEEEGPRYPSKIILNVTMQFIYACVDRCRRRLRAMASCQVFFYQNSCLLSAVADPLESTWKIHEFFFFVIKNIVKLSQVQFANWHTTQICLSSKINGASVRVARLWSTRLAFQFINDGSSLLLCTHFSVAILNERGLIAAVESKRVLFSSLGTVFENHFPTKELWLFFQ